MLVWAPGPGPVPERRGAFISASAARALRRRNDPTVIAVHRRRAIGATPGPVSTARQQLYARAPHIYKYTTKLCLILAPIKSIITPSIQNPRPGTLFLLRSFLETQAYIRTFTP